MIHDDWWLISKYVSAHYDTMICYKDYANWSDTLQNDVKSVTPDKNH